MVFVASLDTLALGAADAHHLGRVLRLRAGESVVAGDGAGGWRLCEWAPPGSVVAAGPVARVASRPAPPLAVGFVPTKGDRPEWTVQKLTELGVDRIVVLTSDRSVVRWEGDRAGRHLDKLREVARQAAMQSRRVWLPVVEGVVPFASLVSGGAGAGAGADAVSRAGAVSGGAAVGRWSLALPGGASPTLGPPGSGTGILIGPEGGWSPEEEAAGLPTVGLGPGILRAETAAVAAGALLTALRAGVVAPAVPAG